MNDGEVEIQDDTTLDVVNIMSQAFWDNKPEWECVDLSPYSNDVLYTYSIMLYIRLYIYILGYIIMYYVYGRGSPYDMIYI